VTGSREDRGSDDPAAKQGLVSDLVNDALGATVSDPDELPRVLKDALATVHGGRSAVVSGQLPRA
jgi:hypothetical protein